MVKLGLFAGVLGLLVGASLLASESVSANHSWGGDHWASTANPFTLKLGDNLSSGWDPYLSTTSSDWSLSSVLDTAIVPGGTVAKRCKPTAGRVEVCNSKYGRNGWLGLAQIWVSGVHITQGVTKLNDTYFDSSYYNKPAWKNLVMCQEVGHNFGLDHQDEDFDNGPLGTCMDYSNDPEPNQHPNAHDYEQLEIIYSHLDAISTIDQVLVRSSLKGREVDLNNPREWGMLAKSQGNPADYE